MMISFSVYILAIDRDMVSGVANIVHEPLRYE